MLHFTYQAFCITQSLCTVVQGQNDHITGVKSFKLLLVTYVYDAMLGTFLPLPEMPLQLPAQLCSAARALQAIESGKPMLLKSYLSCCSKFHVLLWHKCTTHAVKAEHGFAMLLFHSSVSGLSHHFTSCLCRPIAQVLCLRPSFSADCPSTASYFRMFR